MTYIVNFRFNYNRNTDITVTVEGENPSQLKIIMAAAAVFTEVHEFYPLTARYYTITEVEETVAA